MEALRELREDKGWSQQELAWFSDVSKRAIQRIEAGERNPRRSTRRKLEVALGIAQDALGSGDNEIDHDDGVFWEIERVGVFSRCRPYYPDEDQDATSDEEYGDYLELVVE